MKKYIIASSREWFSKSEKIAQFSKLDVVSIKNKEELNLSYINQIKPRFIFFPHWNWIVPKEIYEAYECIVFHTAPLPYGRGGSPIQNLIIRNFETAPVCAIRMNEVLDGGPIYRSLEVSLSGSCEEIFERIAIAVQRIIVDIIENEPEPVPQIGEPTYFKRRIPEESRLPESGIVHDIYNHIRMLDAEGYPNAFIEYGNLKMEFTEAVEESDCIKATVIIKIK